MACRGGPSILVLLSHNGVFGNSFPRSRSAAVTRSRAFSAVFTPRPQTALSRHKLRRASPTARGRGAGLSSQARSARRTASAPLRRPSAGLAARIHARLLRRARRHHRPGSEGPAPAARGRRSAEYEALAGRQPGGNFCPGAAVRPPGKMVVGQYCMAQRRGRSRGNEGMRD